MEVLRDWGALQHHLNAVSRFESGYSTNLYAPREQVDRWCATGSLRILSGEGATLVLRTDRDFDHIYHVARSQDALGTALAALKRGTYTTDLIGEGEALDPVCATYAANGFSPRTTLIRMTRGQPGETPETEDVVQATADDAPAVAALLDRLLDPLAEQVPNVEELRREAHAGRLLIVHHHGELAGMLLYDLKGRTAHLRFWHVDGKAQGGGVGRRLMAAFLSRCAAAQRLVLWVIGDNERSIAIYRHYGFAPDGLLDRIMVRQEQSFE
jgi:ribosomal protein S18 acetylase RimI-like enzyme